MKLKDIPLSKNDIRRGIKIPKKISKDVAYFCGIMAGDGHISNFKDVKHRYNLYCGGNPKDEVKFYDSILSNILKKLFNYCPKMKFFSGGTYGFSFGSKGISLYLTKYIGLPNGAKHKKLKIPKLFLKNKKWLFAFLQGLADTDFCFVLGKRSKIIGSSKSSSFIQEISDCLLKNNITHYKSLDYRYNDIRFKKGYSLISKVEITKKSSMLLWMNLIGFRSNKHLEKYQKWKNKNSGGKI